MYYLAEYNETIEGDLEPIALTVFLPSEDEDEPSQKVVFDKYAFAELLDTLNGLHTTTRSPTDNEYYPYKVFHKNYIEPQ